ncbi:MAG: hypothetical protein HC876_22960 [Chloroflexaceae bacterium]|nr:hypothetical protein [Chloroflexaceae bacterium]
MMHAYTMMAGNGWMGMIIVGMFWLSIIALVVWGLRGLFPLRHESRLSDETNALNILKQRFARGEISRQEFEETRSVLE